LFWFLNEQLLIITPEISFCQGLVFRYKLLEKKRLMPYTSSNMTKRELPKNYDASAVEDKIYQQWEESGYFNPDNLPGERKEAFAIIMPPPNVTGILHVGHAMENTIMDILTRYQRMQGKKTLLLPGLDHAAVATQARVEDNLKKEGIANPRQDLGREELLNRIRTYAAGSRDTILSQVKAIGVSCDWSRLAYTLDEPRSRAVYNLFEKMYNDGLIYRGYRVVNWSTAGQSTCSDDEIEHSDEAAKIYTFKYSADFPIPIATTRPETKLGDTAVAVHPQGKWSQYIGQTFTVADFAGAKLTIQIIGDEAVDKDFGTGAVGVTPAHSMIDFDIYQRHQEIGLVPVIGTDGRILPAFATQAGLTIDEAREQIVAWLRTNNLLISEEEIVHSVGRSDRFKDIVEALPMEQWFIAVNKEIPGRGKTLKELMYEAATSGHGGDKDLQINILPDRFKKSYLHWINNLRDWCISRQIWWGHRIPVWYCVTGCQPLVSFDQPAKCSVCGGTELRQDEDTLDTWFSSAMWTFSTLGWPEQTADLKTFHPTDWMTMGHEIVNIWMARMIMMTTYALDTIPFDTAYIHGLVRDEKGNKFSKSLGNGLDPIELIKSHGTDALRLSLTRGISPGNDLRFGMEKLDSSRNFVNKLWNISRYILSGVEDVRIITTVPTGQTLADQWILSRLAEVTQSVTGLLDRYEFSAAVEQLQSFTWDEVADWYLEIAKIEGDKDEILLYILQNLLKLWHPFIPFITENIWQSIDDSRLLMVADWPMVKTKKSIKDSEFDLVREIITAIRTTRSEHHLDPARQMPTMIAAGDKQKLLASQQAIIERLARCQPLIIADQGEKPVGSIGLVVGTVSVYLTVTEVIDVASHLAKLKEEADQLAVQITRIEAQLANAEFVANAPAKIVTGEKEKLALYQEKTVKLTEQIKSLES